MTKLTSLSLPTPKGTKINSEFGTRFLSKNGHYGIDFQVVENTPITSAGVGRVLRIIEDHKDFGNVVIIKHSDDQVTLYAHLNSIDVTKNYDVNEKTIIGLSGNTGGASTGPHLHFEVIEGSTYVQKIASATGLSIGIGGTEGRINPRKFFDHYTDVEFPVKVSASKSGNGLLEGDSRKNIMFGNTHENILKGKEGYDSYANVGFGDTVDDVDLDGRIMIDSGTQIASLEGNAIPKKDPEENIIDGQWMLDGYDLIRSGSNMLVILAENDVSSIDTPRITISNYPFLQEKAYGITLGKIKTSSYGHPQILSFDDYGQMPCISEGQVERIAIPGKDKRGRFIIPVYPKDKLLYSGYITSMGLGIFNDDGRMVKFNPLIDVSDQFDRTIIGSQIVGISREVSVGWITMAPLSSGNHLAAFTKIDKSYEARNGRMEYISGESFLYKCIIGKNGEIITPPSLIFQANEPSGSNINLSVIGFSANGADVNLNYFEGGSAKSLAIGKNELAGNSYPQTFTLPTGVKVTKYGDERTIEVPKLRDMTRDEILSSYSILQSSELDVAQLEKSAVVSFRKDSDDGIKGKLKITPTVGLRVLVNGAEYGDIDLSALGDLTESEIDSGLTEFTAAEYTLQEFFDKKYDPAKTRRDVEDEEIDMEQLLSRDGEDVVVDEEELFRRDEEGSGFADDDDYYEDPEQQEDDEEIDLDNPATYSVLSLKGNSPEGTPYDIQLIFPALPAAQIRNQTANFFVGYVPEETPQTPNGRDPFQLPEAGALSLLIGGVVVALAAATWGIYKLATDPETREALLRRIDPRNLIGPRAVVPQEVAAERGEGGRGNEIEMQIITVRENVIEENHERKRNPIFEAEEEGELQNELFAESENQSRSDSPANSIRLRSNISKASQGEVSQGAQHL